MKNSIKQSITQIYGVTATPKRSFRVTERIIVAWMVENSTHHVQPEHSLQNFSRKKWTEKNHLERFGADGKNLLQLLLKQ
jgi:hypothetical protein